jgi:hypothetical protein
MDVGGNDGQSRGSAEGSSCLLELRQDQKSKQECRDDVDRDSALMSVDLLKLSSLDA